MNGYVVLFTLAVSLLSGALSDLGPAWTFSKANPQDALREKGESNHSNRMHSSLVFIWCTLAIVLLTATGLLLGSAIRLQSVDLGFRPDHLALENIVLHGDKYDDAHIRSFVDEAIRRVGALPGVKSAAIGSVFGGRLPNSQLEVEGPAAPLQQSMMNLQPGPMSARPFLRHWRFHFCVEDNSPPRMGRQPRGGDCESDHGPKAMAGTGSHRQAF